MRKVKKSNTRNYKTKNKRQEEDIEVIERKKRKDTPKRKDSKIKKKDKDKVKRSLWKKLVTIFLILCIIGVLAVTAFFGYIVITAPEFAESKFDVHDQTVVYDVNGNVMATLGTERRETITYDELPDVLLPLPWFAFGLV